MPRDTPSSGSVLYLRGLTIAMMIFGVVIVVTRLGTDVLFAWMIFGATGTPDGFSSDAAAYIHLGHGVLGAVMVGWFWLVHWVVSGPLAWGVEGAWTALTSSLTAWFVLDTTFSLATGYWQNAVLNTAIAGAYLPGLVAARRPTTHAAGIAA